MGHRVGRIANPSHGPALGPGEDRDLAGADLRRQDRHSGVRHSGEANQVRRLGKGDIAPRRSGRRGP